MSDHHNDRGRASGFEERAPWVVPMADRPDGNDDEDDEQAARPESNDVVWR